MNVTITHTCTGGIPVTKNLNDMDNAELGSVINFLISEFIDRNKQVFNPLEKAVDENFQETQKLNAGDNLECHTKI